MSNLLTKTRLSYFATKLWNNKIKPIKTDLSNHISTGTHRLATTSLDGFMSKDDKYRINDLNERLALGHPESSNKASYLELSIRSGSTETANNNVASVLLGVNKSGVTMFQTKWKNEFRDIFRVDSNTTTYMTFLRECKYAANLVPATDNSIDMGTFTNSFRTVYTKNVSGSGGTVTLIPGQWRGYGNIIVDDGYMYPSMSDKPTLGTSAFRWNTVHSLNGVSTSSDSSLKTNINQITNGVSSLSNKRSNEIQPIDFYNFIKDLNFYTWDWKDKHSMQEGLKTNIGLMADEAITNKIGEMIVIPPIYDEKNDVTSPYAINERNMGMASNIALQIAIKKIEELEERIANIEK